MRKLISLTVLPVLLVFLFSGCGKCDHVWQDASCLAPKTCTLCGEQEGENGEHLWKDATCQSPRFCAVCNATDGSVPGAHNYDSVVFEATEFSGGYTVHTCSFCGDSYQDSFTDPLGYELTEGTMVFRSDGVAYLYGPDGVINKTYTGWMTDVYEVYEAAGAEGITVPWISDYYEGNPDIIRVIIEDGVDPVSTDCWFCRCTNLQMVFVGDDVKELGRGIFDGCSGLTTVRFSSNSTLQRIDEYAFRDYSGWDKHSSVNLSQFSIPKSVTYLGDLPITNDPVVLHEGLLGIGANALRVGEVILPDSVTDIAVGNFEYLSVPENHPNFAVIDNCLIQTSTKTLVDVRDGFTIPNDGSIVIIGDGVFAKKEITEIVLPDGLQIIGKNVFYMCRSLTSVTIPDSVTQIGDDAFHGCYNLSNVNIPANIVSIGEHAFSGCSGTEELVLPDSLESIGEYAFLGWDDLKTVYIPAGVNQIGEAAFARCDQLEAIAVSPDNAEYYTYDRCLIGRTEKVLLLAIGDKSLPNDGSIVLIAVEAIVANEKLNHVVIPNGVTRIGSSVFTGCKNMTYIELPETLTYVGFGCFGDCPNAIIQYNGTVEAWRKIRKGDHYFREDEMPYKVVCSDGECSFWG